MCVYNVLHHAPTLCAYNTYNACLHLCMVGHTIILSMRGEQLHPKRTHRKAPNPSQPKIGRVPSHRRRKERQEYFTILPVFRATRPSELPYQQIDEPGRPAPYWNSICNASNISHGQKGVKQTAKTRKDQSPS